MEGKLGLGNRLKKINPLDDVFGIENNQSEQIEQIPIDMLVHYIEHKFKLYSGQRKQDLVQSIKTHGILTPIIVTPSQNEQYMILAGHNRTECAKEAGLKEIPAKIIKNITKLQAKQIVIETNLFQRSFSELPTSEKAEIISDYYELKKENGENISDIETEIQKLSELSPVGTEDKKASVSPLGTRQIGQKYSLSKNTIARLLRIHKLVAELKEKIDAEEISLRAGVDLSYLLQNEQHIVVEIINQHDIKIDMKKSAQLKMLKKELQQLEEQDIKTILLASSSNQSNVQKKIKPIKIKRKLIEKYFKKEQDEDEIQNIVEKALEKYFEEGDIY
ncbi:ParB N-terminal domain-containing protein [Sedimentibacter sp. zth1]|uniref:ParB N-terminal domain-containing protein n=1 Tax=Sedimentibacter sp. zth1 TaxID=2816908 RepID=UPI001A9373AE|nr:ParB N-terminal domain-containing protein [Sedimentibacter sp. zth1]QSX05455.1 ParB N-terminal domain-containing protein [Sedimentibacter sp. zth1]